MTVKSMLKKPVKGILQRFMLYGRFDYLQEIYWSQVYHDTIRDSEWLQDKAVSPGRAAVGYNFLYVLYRALNAMHPSSILELGLGQSTKVVSQYARFFEVEHIVVDHDQNWADFFRADNERLLGGTDIRVLPLDICPTNGGEKKLADINLFAGNVDLSGDYYYAYHGFAEAMRGRRFSFILIDAPFGWINPTHARRDILPLLPDILEDDFVILLDDAGRRGEQHTLADIKEILMANQIDFAEAIYPGASKKECWICASKNWKFLTTV